MSTPVGSHKLRDPVPAEVGRHVDLPTIGYSGRPWLDKTWEDYAACRSIDNPDIFLPSKADPDRTEHSKQARALCGTCTVQEACEEAAIARGEQYGTWAGRGATSLKATRSKRLAAATRDA